MDSTTATHKKETSLPPKLTLPTSLNRRISLLAGARLSPSIVLRTPPLPILNLPKLPVVTPNESAGGASSAGGANDLQRRRSERAGLGSMPALTLQGTTRGAGGHEEPDDMDDEDDMEDIDEEEDMDDEDRDDVDENDQEDMTRTSMSTDSMSSGLSSDGPLTGRGSYDLPPSLQRVVPPTQPNPLDKPVLPPLSLFSPLEFRFQSDSTASSSGPHRLATATTAAAGASGASSYHAGSSSLTSGMVAAAAAGAIGSSGLPMMDKKGKHKQIVVPTFSSNSPLESGYASSFGSSAPSSSASSSFMGSAPSTGRSVDRPSLVISPPNTSSSYKSFGESYKSEQQQQHQHGHGGDYFGQPQAISHSRSDGSDKTPSAIQRPDPFDSPQTPRAQPVSKIGPSREFEVRPRPRPAREGSFNLNRNSVASNARDSLLVERPSMYRRASRSLVDLHAVEKKEEVEKMVREKEQEQERAEVERRRSIRRSIIIANAEAAQRDSAIYRMSGIDREKAIVSGLGWLVEEGETVPKREGEDNVAGATRSVHATTRGVGHNGPLDGRSNAAGGEVSDLGNAATGVVSGSLVVRGEREGTTASASSTVTTATLQQQKQQNRVSLAPAYEVSIGATVGPTPLRKRRSMPMFNETTAPPPYPTFAPHPFGRQNMFSHLQPREDEGREALPSYSNAIYLKAILPRKMEFLAPGVQAKDRKWKRVLCVLEGTMLKVYRCPVGAGGVSAIEQWWESKVGAGDMTLASGPSTTTAAGSSRTNGAAAAAAVAQSTRSREEEKATQQYLRSHHVHDELRSGAGPQLGQAQATAGAGRQVYGSASQQYQPGQTQVAITKSALNLAVHYFKPGTRHTRSSSDAGPPSPVAPRPQVVIKAYGPLELVHERPFLKAGDPELGF
ncbi:hypothetical protein H1R20_g3138, partial [Candolleomyces eurysporus]